MDVLTKPSKRSPKSATGRLRGYNEKLFLYRFELLLFSLFLVLFDKIFIRHNEIYVRYVWPINMLVLGLVSFGIFKERGFYIKLIKNVLFILSMFIPFFAFKVFNNRELSMAALSTYVVYYAFILTEVFRQILRPRVVTASVVIGALCGYLLLVVIGIFTFMLIEYYHPGSFSGTTNDNITIFYQEITYYTMITMSTIGYGDIVPVAHEARMLSAFFGTLGQFYVVTFVAIIVSKFSSRLG
ncbi:MAG: ion channel [Flavobacteriales bacterium]|nr:ion channel [Flavobacteriales bacterium]MCX7650616.1 ion channel [Flavobacteriales bacterium]MDW8431989.1 ion channel [Flavobacteriales bacterium]